MTSGCRRWIAIVASAEPTAAEQNEARAHEQACARCRAQAAFLSELGRLAPRPEPVDSPAAQGLVEAVLRRAAVAPQPARWRPALLAALSTALAAAAVVALWLRPRGWGEVSSGRFEAERRVLAPGDRLPLGVPLRAVERACLSARGTRLCLRGAARLLGSERQPRLELIEGELVGVVATPMAVATAGAVVQSQDASFVLRDEQIRVLRGVVQCDRRSGGLRQVEPVHAREALSFATGRRWRLTGAEASGRSFAAFAADEPDRRTALLRLVDALHERGRVRDAEGIARALARSHPGDREVDAALARLATPARQTSATPTPALYRLNAGGPRYVDPAGNVWEPDSRFTSQGNTWEIADDIDGTDLDPLYRSERWDPRPAPNLTYRLPVPPGTYALRLHFAEMYGPASQAGERVFDVLVEGVPALRDYDIAAEVGFLTATIKQFVVKVSDGALDIELAPKMLEPKISAIEVLPTIDGEPPPMSARPPPLPLPPTDALYRVNAGGREYVDPEGRLWEADRYHNGKGKVFHILTDVAATELQPIYRTERFDDAAAPGLAYAFPVPPGEYLVRLHLSENSGHLRGAGRRVFDVFLEERRVLEHLDIFAEAGFQMALVKESTVSVTDGTLDLRFAHVVDNPKIDGIEIIPR